MKSQPFCPTVHLTFFCFDPDSRYDTAHLQFRLARSVRTLTPAVPLLKMSYPSTSLPRAADRHM